MKKDRRKWWKRNEEGKKKLRGKEKTDEGKEMKVKMKRRRKKKIKWEREWKGDPQTR